MAQNAQELKEKIIFFIKTNGPSLPVHIAKYIESNVLFTSAFLSELFSEKRIKISNMKVGNSPLYFIQGQEHLLERFSQHLKSKEKDAFMILKEKKFLKDSEQAPAIRVALRAIKDFAIPFKKNDEIFWRYHTVPEAEFTLPIIEIKEEKQKKPEIKAYSPLEIKPAEIKLIEVGEKKLEGTEEIKPEIQIKKKEPKKIKKVRKLQKKDNNFFNKVKEWTFANSIEIINIEGFSKNELQLKVKNNEEEHLLVAYNKKRLEESDLVKANKKARELNLKYTILSLGEPIKKMNDLIDAVKNLSKIRKIE
ncbi:MAG: hypothetical protein ABIH65_02795 [Nanoarchaeota archaeon]